MLDFFTISTSKKCYLGMSYNKKRWRESILDVVWVANLNNLIIGTSETLMIDTFRNLKILSGRTSFIIVNFVQPHNNTSATLQDIGNLVLRELNSGGCQRKILRKSFNYYPTCTFY